MSTPQSEQEPRSRRAARLAVPLITRAANEVLESTLSTHLSQTEWESISHQIARASAVLLDADFDYCKMVTEGDATDPKGNVNVAPVLAALRSMAEHAKKGNRKARLLYLAQHFENLMRDLNILREVPDGQPEET